MTRERRERDSNPRGCSPSCFQDSRNSPLCHPSVTEYTTSSIYFGRGYEKRASRIRLANGQFRLSATDHGAKPELSIRQSYPSEYLISCTYPTKHHTRRKLLQC